MTREPIRSLRAGSLAFVLMVVACTASYAASPVQVFADETVSVNGTSRSFRLVVPAAVPVAASSDVPVPLVIALHGMAIDSKDVMPTYSGLDALAAANGFLLAYPQAEAGSWGISADKVRRDVAFFDALLAALRSRYAIDHRRIYVVGMSNGGYFAHVLARERAEVVAAIASHSGPLGLETFFRIGARRKFPVLIVHGDRDRLFPVSFARENRAKYQREGHPVVYVEVPRLGHAWSRGIESRMWGFLSSHALPRSER